MLPHNQHWPINPIGVFPGTRFLGEAFKSGQAKSHGHSSWFCAFEGYCQVYIVAVLGYKTLRSCCNNRNESKRVVLAMLQQLCQNNTQTHIVYVNMSRIKSVGMPQQVQNGRDWDSEWQDITAHYSHNLLAVLSAILSKHVSDFKCACATLLFYRAYVSTLRSHTLYYKSNIIWLL